MTSVDRSTRHALLARVAVVVVVGLGLGVATSYLQGVLPGSVNFLANSGAVWTLFAFALAWWVVAGSSTLAGGVVAGVGALVGEVLGYYAIASPLRGIATTPAERTLWIAAGFVFGAVAGAAAHAARHGAPPRPALAAGAVSGMFVGEGVHAAIRLGYPTQAAIELGVAVAVLVASIRVVRSPRDVGVAVCSMLAVGALVAAAYSVV